MTATVGGAVVVAFAQTSLQKKTSAAKAFDKLDWTRRALRAVVVEHASSS